MAALPQELVDSIVDHLSDDKAALVSLLNASSLFGGRVRTHLYRSVDLVVDYSYARPSWYALSTRSKRFLFLIISAPAIGDMVMELKCDITPVHVLRLAPYWKLVRDLVVRLRRLDVIHLQNKTALVGTTYVSSLTAALASSTVSKVSIVGTFVVPQCLVHFLSAFPNVRALHIEDVLHDGTKMAAVDPLTPSPPCIHELLVRKSSAFLQELRTENWPIPLKGLRRLVLLWFQEVNGCNDWETLRDFLNRVDVQELYIQVTEWTTHMDHDIRGIARVPHLTIQLRTGYVSWLTAVLLNASQHHDQATLASLNLIIYWDDVSQTDDFAALGAALSLPHFQTCIAIRVIFSHCYIAEPAILRRLHDTMQSVWNALDQAGLKGRVKVESREVPFIDTYFKDL